MAARRRANIAGGAARLVQRRATVVIVEKGRA